MYHAYVCIGADYEGHRVVGSGATMEDCLDDFRDNEGCDFTFIVKSFDSSRPFKLFLENDIPDEADERDFAVLHVLDNGEILTYNCEEVSSPRLLKSRWTFPSLRFGDGFIEKKVCIHVNAEGETNIVPAGFETGASTEAPSFITESSAAQLVEVRFKLPVPANLDGRAQIVGFLDSELKFPDQKFRRCPPANSGVLEVFVTVDIIVLSNGYSLHSVHGSDVEHEMCKNKLKWYEEDWRKFTVGLLLAKQGRHSYLDAWVNRDEQKEGRKSAR